MSAVPILQPGVGEIPGDHYVRATPETVLWGRLPCAADTAVLEIASGETVTFDTVSHEGILDDQGKDPAAYFASHGVPPEHVLDDAIEIAASVPRDVMPTVRTSSSVPCTCAARTPAIC